MQNQRIRIRLRAYRFPHARQECLRNRGNRQAHRRPRRGPDPSAHPHRKVLREPFVHVDKKSADQFEIRTHKRLLDIVDPTARTVDELKKLNLPAGVDIHIKI